jgi:hypothetical protein
VVHTAVHWDESMTIRRNPKRCNSAKIRTKF